ncbi:MAG: phytanoyl-CoA dioxygenase family protein, partial [Gammaproteobacteria bacterium]|nr:phytanoyl-CoA dioxygenase family protein [Gammaproteobacteria bacterium]
FPVPAQYGDTQLLQTFRKSRMAMFFDDAIIDEFCDAAEEEMQKFDASPAKNSSNQLLLDELVENGFCVVKNLFSKEQVEGWHKSVYPHVNAELGTFEKLHEQHGVASGMDVHLQKEKIKYCYNLRCGTIRAWGIDAIDETLKQIPANPVLQDICKSYFSGRCNISKLYADYKGIVGVKDASTVLHADSSFKILKVFVPLRDVGPDNAPFIYYKKSQRLAGWRLLKDFLNFTNYGKKYFSTFASWGDIGMCRLVTKFPELAEQESIVTASAGDVIIADTHGVHGASILQKEHRLQIGYVYGAIGGRGAGSDIPSHVKAMARDVE